MGGVSIATLVTTPTLMFMGYFYFFVSQIMVIKLPASTTVLKSKKLPSAELMSINYIESDR